MSYFDQNIQAIKKRNIVLYEQIQIQQNRVLDRVISEPSKDGNSYMKVCVGGQWTALNSTYRPLAEADKFAMAYADMELYSRLLVFGLGNGYFARALITRNLPGGQETADGMYSHTRFAFYEPELTLFLYALHTYDLSDILSNPDVEIFIEGINENQLSGWCLNNVSQMNLGAFRFVALPKYKICFSDAYERVQHVYEDTIHCVHADTGTKRQLAKQIAKNNFENLRHFYNSRNLKEFMAQYPKDLPFLIVSAGPSLANSLEELKKIRENVFLMAMDSAAKYLMKEGIRPDGIFVIDMGKPVSLFTEEMRDIPFFVHTDVNYEVLDYVKPRDIYFVTTNMVYYEKQALMKGDSLSCLDTGGSVATAAFSFAVSLGVDTIVLMGQDLSVSGGSTHISDLHRELDFYTTIKGNEEEALNTFFDFYIYLRWFESQIAKYPDIRVINATKGGAYIKGTEYLHGSDLFASICTEQWEQLCREFKVAWEQSGLPDVCGEQAISDIYDALQQNIAEVKELLQKGCALTAQAKKELQENGVQGEGLLKINRSLDVLGAELIKTDALEWLELYVKDREDEVMNDLYQRQESVEEEYLVSYDKLQKYYELLLGAVNGYKG